MSNRELCVKLLDNVPEYKIVYVLAYIQGMTADEEAHDAFCERMIESSIFSFLYINLPKDIFTLNNRLRFF